MEIIEVTSQEELETYAPVVLLSKIIGWQRRYLAAGVRCLNKSSVKIIKYQYKQTGSRPRYYIREQDREQVIRYLAGKEKKVVLHLPDELYEALRGEARRHGSTLQAYLVDALDKHRRLR